MVTPQECSARKKLSSFKQNSFFQSQVKLRFFRQQTTRFHLVPCSFQDGPTCPSWYLGTSPNHTPLLLQLTDVSLPTIWRQVESICPPVFRRSCLHPFFFFCWGLRGRRKKNPLILFHQIKSTDGLHMERRKWVMAAASSPDEPLLLKFSSQTAPPSQRRGQPQTISCPLLLLLFWVFEL